MFRWLFSFSILVLFLGGLIYFALAYQVVRTDKGYNVVKKSEWEFNAPVVDMDDWKLSDLADELEFTSARAEAKFKELRKATREGWRDLSSQFDDFGNFNSDKATAKVQKSFRKLKQETEERYDRLVKRWEKGDLNADEFSKQLKKLRQWTREQLRELEKNL